MADLKNTEATEAQHWAVQRNPLPSDVCEEPWPIEEEAPRWPDGVRMYHADTRIISQTVREVLTTLTPDGTFDDKQHFALGMAIFDAIIEHGAAPDVSYIDTADYLSLAFLAGVQWGKASHARGRVPSQSDPWWMSAGGDVEEDYKAPKWPIIPALQFPAIVQRLRVLRNLDEKHPELTAHLDQVLYDGVKPSPELLDLLQYHFVEGVR